MALITILKKQVVTRRPPEQVLGVVSAASPRGSTYHARLRRCPREHALYTNVGLVPDGDAEALTVGWLFHHALEQYYRQLKQVQDARGGLVWVRNEYRGAVLVEITSHARAHALESLQGFVSEPGYEDTYPQLLKMLDGYFEEYMSDRWYVVAVEEQLAVATPFEYSARLDLVVIDLDAGEDNDGVLRIVEHKTAKSFSSDLLAGYQLNQQLMGQAWLLMACVDLENYPVFAGVTVNLISKHKAPQYLRVPVAVSPEHLSAFMNGMKAWDKLGEAFAAVGYPPDFTKCSGYARGYTTCGYYNLCYSNPDLDLDDLVESTHNGSLPTGYRVRGAEDSNDNTVE